MICPRCRHPMEEQRRTYHKKRKWKCPRCGRVRMQAAGGRPRRRKAED